MNLTAPAATPELNEFVSLACNIRQTEVPAIFESWIQSLWFPPSDFSSSVAMGNIEIVYIPFWMYEVAVTTACTAKVVRNEADPHHGTRSGNERIQSVESIYNHNYPKLLICAPAPSTQGYDKIVVSLVDQISNLEKYPLIRSGTFPSHARIWNSLLYTQVWSEIGEKIIQRKEREKCEADLSSQHFVASVKELSLDINFNSVNHCLVHLPFYVIDYTYGGNQYKWVCSATSGAAQGTRPYGLGKVGQLGKASYELVSGFLGKRE